MVKIELQKNELKKFVYSDDTKTKVVKGHIISESEFTYTIKAIETEKIIVIGKRFLIQMTNVGGG